MDVETPMSTEPAAEAGWSASPARVSVGTIVGGTFALWKKHPHPFLISALVLELPQLFATFQTTAAAARGARVNTLWTSLTALAFGVLLNGMLIHGALESSAGRPVRLAAMLQTGLRRYGRVLAVTLLASVIIGVTFLLLVVPGLMSMSALWVAVPATLAEPDRSQAPVERSRELTKGHRWTVFLGLVILLLPGVAAYLAFDAAATLFLASGGGAGGILAIVAAALASAFASGLHATGPAVAFLQLRSAREGGDQRSLEKVFE